MDINVLILKRTAGSSFCKDCKSTHIQQTILCKKRLKNFFLPPHLFSAWRVSFILFAKTGGFSTGRELCSDSVRQSRSNVALEFCDSRKSVDNIIYDMFVNFRKV